MPRPDDVRAAAPGHLDHGVAEGRGHTTPFRDDAERVLAMNRSPVDDELLVVGEPDRDAVRAGPPLPRRVRETLRLTGQPVQAGDRQEAVPVVAHRLVLPVP